MTQQNQDKSLNSAMELLIDNGFEGAAEAIAVLLNAAMAVERSAYLDAQPYERTAERRGYANGFKDKTLKTRLGALPLKVPQTRDGGFYPQSLEKGLRSERAMVAGVGVVSRGQDEKVRLEKTGNIRACVSIDSDRPPFAIGFAAGIPISGPEQLFGNGHRIERRMDPAARSAIHALTASGAVLGLLAILSVMRSDARTSLLWLALALAVDALDGPLARKLRVRNVIPNVDGEVLDLVVDYSNYVLAPALFFTPSACCRKAGSSRVPASSC